MSDVPMNAAGDRPFAWNANIAATGSAPSTLPLFTLSPMTAQGRQTVGFSFAMFAATAGASVAAAGGFTIAPYRYIPSLGLWAAMDVYTGYVYGQQLICYDVGAGTGLTFDVYNATADGGNVVLVVGELD